MKNDNVTELVQPGEFKDQLTEILKQGARSLVFGPVLRKLRFEATIIDILIKSKTLEIQTEPSKISKREFLYRSNTVLRH